MVPADMLNPSFLYLFSSSFLKSLNVCFLLIKCIISSRLVVYGWLSVLTRGGALDSPASLHIISSDRGRGVLSVKPIFLDFMSFRFSNPQISRNIFCVLGVAIM